MLAKLDGTWKDILFDFRAHKDSGVHMLKLVEEEFEMLEEHQGAVSAMFTSRYLSTFETRITYWQKSLANIGEINMIALEV